MPSRMRSLFSNESRLGVVINTVPWARKHRWISCRNAFVSTKCSITSPAKIKSKLLSSKGMGSWLRSQCLASSPRCWVILPFSWSISMPVQTHHRFFQYIAQSPVQHPMSSIRPHGRDCIILKHFLGDSHESYKGIAQWYCNYLLISLNPHPFLTKPFSQ